MDLTPALRSLLLTSSFSRQRQIHRVAYSQRLKFDFVSKQNLSRHWSFGTIIAGSGGQIFLQIEIWSLGICNPLARYYNAEARFCLPPSTTRSGENRRIKSLAALTVPWLINGRRRRRRRRQRWEWKRFSRHCPSPGSMQTARPPLACSAPCWQFSKGYTGWFGLSYPLIWYFAKFKIQLWCDISCFSVFWFSSTGAL